MAAIVFKLIKPPKLKDDVMRKELLNAMRKTGKEIKKDFEKTTATWNNKPKFEISISLAGPGPIVLVDTDNDIYRYISKGTGIYGEGRGEYIIMAGIYTGRSNKKALAFSSSSTPKTRPGFIGSTGGSRSGNMVVRPYVVHKGIKPRKFDEVIEKERQPWFKKEMEKAMARAAKKSGYGK